MDLVEQLLLARGGGDAASRAWYIRDDELSLRGHLRNGETQTTQIPDLLAARIGKVSAGNLTGTLEQVPYERRAAELVP